ncbi:MAG: NAD(P)-binding domain-containing protein, partial [Saprospiraceae bacterium]|nr:NAD(P)-binding domain-containing protein [Saprospiraceae bacterium]
MYQTFGIIGMGVMGKSLARNLASKGYKLSLYN